MAEGQPVAEFGEQLASIIGGVGIGNSVVQMDLDFSPSGMAMTGEQVEQALVVLLSGIEVSVDERAAIVVTPGVDDFGILAHPPFQAALLLGARRALLTVFGNNGRFEVVGQGQNQMHRAVDRRLQSAPGRGQHYLSGIGELFSETHLAVRCPAPTGALIPKSYGIAKAIPGYATRSSAGRGDCTDGSAIGINLQEMTRLFRRRECRAGVLFPLFDDLQQGCRKRHGKIGEELVGLGGKASAHDEADQRALQGSDKQNNVGIEILRLSQDSQILKAAVEEYEVKNQNGNAAFDADLEVGHVHVVPDQGVGLEVAHAQAENRIVFDALDGAQHEVLAILVGAVGGLIGGAVTRQGGEAIIEFSPEGPHDDDTHEGSGHEQIKAFTFDGEVVESNTAGDNKVD